MPTSTDHKQGGQDQQGGQDDKHMMRKMYLRFGAMIATAMVVMYAVMYVGTWEWGHVTFSESRVFMALTMGGAMGLVMLAWMLNMYKNTKANIAVVVASVSLFSLGVFLDRSQTTVQGPAWMSAMIPHHSLAITRSARAEIDDVRVCRLAADIIAAQKREIQEMQWLIDDIEQNGPAQTAADAEARQVPEFTVEALRDCPSP